MSVYFVSLEWFNDDSGKLEKPTKYYFFDDAEKALNFAHDIAWDGYHYIKYGKPTDVYLYQIEDGQYVTEDSILQYMTCFLDLDNVNWDYRVKYNNIGDF